ncbi:hypothetical protein [Paractinoplanes globisporus]|uniref:Uncharacterized protein n=1 Tax=Paractinoplanes globisporus TaxID=113565 RepID=A0ABW6WGJ7_9ACTN|nr:hypothetical protein [Actinoplanes globisporus]
MPARTDSTYQVDRGILRMLLDSYWNSDGWRSDVPPPAKAAVAAGVMFDQPWVAGHDEVVEAARAAAKRLDIGEVSDAFLAGLTAKRMDLRSALGSYAVARHLPAHTFRPGTDAHRCDLCGLIDDVQPIDRNAMNFERFKWGGVRRDDLGYVAFDLAQFARAPRLEMQGADVELGQELIAALRSLPPKTTAAQAATALKLLPGNKDERSAVLDILGVCGILRAGSRPSYAEAFVPYSARELPPAHHSDLSYPVCWWRASHGVAASGLRTFLPRLR